MRRRRDQIGDRGTGVIILRDSYGHQGGGRSENGFYPQRRTRSQPPKAFACFAPGVPGQGSIAKSLGIERKRYHAHFRSHSLASKHADVTILRRNNVLF